MRLETIGLSASARQVLGTAVACLGAMVVGEIDLLTGTEIHVVSLYFVPLVFAGWRLRRGAAAAVALFSTLVWLGALYEEGMRFSQPHVWVINFITQGCAFLIVAMLVSRLSQQLGEEQALRRVDPLTGLKNRHGFIEQATGVLPLCHRQARPVAMAYIDLDNFKRANDALGHAYGDTLLQRCGEIIAACVRCSDIAARMGGDEFVILLPDADHGQAMEVRQRILRMLETAPEFATAGVTASIGVVVDDSKRHDVAELLRLADAEMYGVKNSARSPDASSAAARGLARGSRGAAE